MSAHGRGPLLLIDPSKTPKGTVTASGSHIADAAIVLRPTHYLHDADDLQAYAKALDEAGLEHELGQATVVGMGRCERCAS